MLREKTKISFGEEESKEFYGQHNNALFFSQIYMGVDNKTFLKFDMFLLYGHIGLSKV